ncbi:hypothetical protein [Fischerella sp. PCC 9605]|uniref:hypothetical protein n=1 Tax=Fischerella sp. PCC 9605 TaxID=1173024 RepID=UPI00047AACCC|nr:hypothetical protein [Fischerella sp. PCC 9605]
MAKDNRGNPNIKNYGYKTDKEEPLTESMTIKMPKSMKDKVKAKDNPAEFCRQAIQKALDEDKQDK